MGNNWWKPRVRSGKQNWDPKLAKRSTTPTPRPHDDMVTEYVSVVLKKIGAGDDDDANAQISVPGTMTFEAFTTKARERLNMADNRPIQWFVGPRSVAPDNGALMSSFPKHDYLYISYV